MCIKIVKLRTEAEYDMSKPLEDQLRGSKQIVINYEPKNPSINHFLDEMEKLCQSGVSASLNIKFNHNNYLRGQKVCKEIKKLAQGLDFNEVIKVLAGMQSEMDKKLAEVSQICLKR